MRTLRLSVFPALVLALFSVSCSGKDTSSRIIPPETPPLTRPIIGYGVVNTFYARLLAETGEEGTVLGLVRIGTVLSVRERRQTGRGAAVRAWLFVKVEDSGEEGWIPEDLVDEYPNEAQARIAGQGLR
ncbi:MAG: hypothetical protein FWD94_04330 [Treponema sp.]|nr:hypothetical protein [Treponema sp.]